MAKVKIEGNASGTGTFTIAAPNSNSDRTLTLPDEAGTVLTSASDIAASQLPAGSVIQVVQGVLTTFPTTSSTTFVDSGLTASITPASATSKILVTYHVMLYCPAASLAAFTKLDRDGTSLLQIATTASASGGTGGVASMSYLDSPSTTSSTTYKVQFASSSGATVEFNTSWGALSGEKATITLMEIAA